MQCLWCNNEALFSRWCCQSCLDEQDEKVIREREQAAKARHKSASWTYIYFCGNCGTEVYRHSHIRRRTEHLVQKVGQESRFALFQHVQRMQHNGYLQEARINEHWGDKGFEIPGTEPSPPGSSCSEVMRILGGLP